MHGSTCVQKPGVLAAFFSLFSCYDQVPDKGTLGEEEFIWAHNTRDLVHYHSVYGSGGWLGFLHPSVREVAEDGT